MAMLNAMKSPGTVSRRSATGVRGPMQRRNARDSSEEFEKCKRHLRLLTLAASPVPSRRGKRAFRWESSTKFFGTAVLLLLASAKTMLSVIGPLARNPMVGESLAKVRGSVGCTDRRQAHSLNLLDIGAQRVSMAPGLFLALEAPCPADSQYYSWPC